MSYNNSLIHYAEAWFPDGNVFNEAVHEGAKPLTEVADNVDNTTNAGDLLIFMSNTYTPGSTVQYPVNVTSRGLLCEVNFTIASHAADTQLDFISAPSLNVVIAPSYILPSYSTCVETINGTYSAGGDPALIRETNPDIPESAALMLALVGPAATLALILTRRKRARASRDFEVRLYWTAPHRLDDVGLDTSPPAPITVTAAAPTLALHSALGDVTERLLYADGQYVKLVNGQQIRPWFTLPNNAQDTTTNFIF